MTVGGEGCFFPHTVPGALFWYVLQVHAVLPQWLPTPLAVDQEALREPQSGVFTLPLGNKHHQEEQNRSHYQGNQVQHVRLIRIKRRDLRLACRKRRRNRHVSEALRDAAEEVGSGARRETHS